jgi:hypothetical protein
MPFTMMLSITVPILNRLSVLVYSWISFAVILSSSVAENRNSKLEICGGARPSFCFRLSAEEKLYVGIFESLGGRPVGRKFLGAGLPGPALHRECSPLGICIG